MINRRSVFILTAIYSLWTSRALASEAQPTFRESVEAAQKIGSSTEFRRTVSAVFFYIDALNAAGIAKEKYDIAMRSIQQAIDSADVTFSALHRLDLGMIKNAIEEEEKHTEAFYSVLEKIGISPTSISANLIILGIGAIFAAKSLERQPQTAKDWDICIWPFCDGE